MDDDPEVLSEYEVIILDKHIRVEAPNSIEAGTRALEELKGKESFQIGTIVPIINIDTGIQEYVLAEIILANAGLYYHAKQVSEVYKKTKKKKK